MFWRFAERVAVVSPHAAQEYLKGNPRAGLTPEIAHGRLTTFLASKAGEAGSLGDPVTAGKLMLVNGLKMNDAQIVAAGVGEGIPTLTSDFRMANKVPDLTEIYRPN